MRNRTKKILIFMCVLVLCMQLSACNTGGNRSDEVVNFTDPFLDGYIYISPYALKKQGEDKIITLNYEIITNYIGEDGSFNDVFTAEVMQNGILLEEVSSENAENPLIPDNVASVKISYRLLDSEAGLNIVVKKNYDKNLVQHSLIDSAYFPQASM